MQLKSMSLTGMLAAISAITYSTGISFVPQSCDSSLESQVVAKAASFGRNMVAFPKKK